MKIIKLYIMEKKFTLDVLYSDGTISNEYDSTKKVVAVVSGSTYVGLKNTIKSDWCIVCGQCESAKGKGYYGYLPPISFLELWHKDINNINATMRELKMLGVNADEFVTVATYWSSSDSLGEAKALSFPLGTVAKYAYTIPQYGRASIALE